MSTSSDCIGIHADDINTVQCTNEHKFDKKHKDIGRKKHTLTHTHIYNEMYKFNNNTNKHINTQTNIKKLSKTAFTPG